MCNGTKKVILNVMCPVDHSSFYQEIMTSTLVRLAKKVKEQGERCFLKVIDHQCYMSIRVI
jgi:hypothetical protein